MSEFVPFQKIPRLSREIFITEKIDGTNACVHIGEAGEFLIGSRTRWITPDDDNFGFARWATENKEDLLRLGPGTHFGEWWGSGIQRGYGLPKDEKRFSLFNISRWGDAAVRPRCCHAVPLLYQGQFDTLKIEETVFWLARNGSAAASGFMKPEGIIIYHTAANMYFKKTLEKDDEHKGKHRFCTYS